MEIGSQVSEAHALDPLTTALMLGGGGRMEGGLGSPRLGTSWQGAKETFLLCGI